MPSKARRNPFRGSAQTLHGVGLRYFDWYTLRARHVQVFEEHVVPVSDHVL
jgi:hypothetical protein